MQQNNFNWPLINDNISQQDKKKLSEFVLQTNRFTNGPKVKQFEKAWSIWLGVNYSVMVNSGSSANYITAAITREIKGQSGEIIVPPIGWVSDIASVINTGFTPVFVDVDLKTMSMSYENIKNAINENTKAIVLVHGLGFNGINDKIIELAKKHNLILIEDCCEAHGAKHENHFVGTFGDMSCFSFYFGHHITTIEGGMICTNNKDIYELAKMYRSHGMTREASKETQEKYSKSDLNPLFTFAVPGYNMRSSEINAVLGLEQIKRLDDNIKIRAENLGVWLNALNSDLYYTDFNYKNNSNFALPLIAKNKSIIEKACLVLEEQKVEYRIGTAGGGNQARQPYLANYNYKVNGELNNSNYIHDCGLYVGNHTEIDKNKIEKLCTELNNV